MKVIGVVIVVLMGVVCMVDAAHLISKVFEKQGVLSAAGAGGGDSVKLFIAYMDEEISELLKPVIGLKQKGDENCKSVYILERRNRNEEQANVFDSYLFERPLVSWPHLGDGIVRWSFKGKGPLKKGEKPEMKHWKKEKVVPRPTKADAAADSDFEKKMLTNILKHYITQEFADKMKPLGSPNGGKSDPKFPELVVYRHGKPASGSQCVCLRAPEMGLEPDLASMYFEQAAKAFDGMDMDMFCDGAGGAAGKNDVPGCAHDITASLFNGALVKGDKYVGAMKMYNFKGDSPDENGITIKETATASKDKDGWKKVEKEAKKNWHSVTTDGGKDLLKKVKAEWRKAISVKGHRDGEEVGTTTGFFQGAIDKKASALVGTHASNMEDSWLIKCIINLKKNTGKKGYPNLGKHVVFRVDADPFHIPDQETKDFNTWCSGQKSVKQSEVVAVIMWAVHGMDTTKVPKELCWTNDKALKTNFVQMKQDGGEKCVADPFRMEWATDFPAKACKILDAGEADTSKCKEAQKAFFEAVKGAKDVQGLAAVKAKATAFVKEVAKLFGSKDDKMPVWIRDKWKFQSDGELTSQKLEKLKLTPEGVDRAYYKASNFPAMNRVNTYIFNGKYASLTEKKFGKKLGFDYFLNHPKELLDETCKISKEKL